MDIQMPVMDGFEATMVIRKFETNIKNSKNSKVFDKLDSVPIIAMTAHAVKGYKQRYMT
jgi:CheY-like chemotaxis protein